MKLWIKRFGRKARTTRLTLVGGKQRLTLGLNQYLEVPSESLEEAMETFPGILEVADQTSMAEWASFMVTSDDKIESFPYEEIPWSLFLVHKAEREQWDKENPRRAVTRSELLLADKIEAAG